MVAAWADYGLYRFRRPILVAAVVVTVLSLSLPYNVSFKLISAVGLIAMPIACWAFAKLADLPFPIPPIASAAGLIFPYNRRTASTTAPATSSAAASTRPWPASSPSRSA